MSTQDRPDPPVTPRRRNGLGDAGLVLGIVAVVMSLVPVLNVFMWPLGVAAVAFGGAGWSRANRAEASNRGRAIAGLVLGLASFFTFCLVYLVIGTDSSLYHGAG